jgi:hypothetical protein
VNPPVFAALNVTAVRNFVGTNPVRVYPNGRAPQNVQRPYITWQIVGGSPVNNLSDNPDMDESRVRVWCYSEETAGSAAARNLATAVRNALEAVTHVTFGPTDEADQEPGLLVWIMDADFWDDR